MPTTASAATWGNWSFSHLQPLAVPLPKDRFLMQARAPQRAKPGDRQMGGSSEAGDYLRAGEGLIISSDIASLNGLLQKGNDLLGLGSENQDLLRRCGKLCWCDLGCSVIHLSRWRGPRKAKRSHDEKHQSNTSKNTTKTLPADKWMAWRKHVTWCKIFQSKYRHRRFYCRMHATPNRPTRPSKSLLNRPCWLSSLIVVVVED